MTNRCWTLLENAIIPSKKLDISRTWNSPIRFLSWILTLSLSFEQVNQEMMVLEWIKTSLYVLREHLSTYDNKTYAIIYSSTLLSPPQKRSTPLLVRSNLFGSDKHLFDARESLKHKENSFHSRLNESKQGAFNFCWHFRFDVLSLIFILVPTTLICF